MRRLFILAGVAAGLLCSAARVAAQDDQYVQIYNLIQDADTLNHSGQNLPALAKYIEAQKSLEKFQKIYPTWHTRVVNFRLNYLNARVAELSKTVPAAPSATAGVSAGKPLPARERAELENELDRLRTQVRQLQAEKDALEAKLREALAAQPAAVDPRELAKAEERIRALEKENGLLHVNLAEREAATPPGVDAATLERLRRDLAAQTETAARLSEQNERLQTRVRTLQADAEAMAALQSENEILKKQVADLKGVAGVSTSAAVANRQLAEAQAEIAALQSDKEIARVKQLERERADLQKKLDAAQKELTGRKRKNAAAQVDDLTAQLASLRARLAVYEAQQVPYSGEELALFKTGETAAAANPRTGQISARGLPAGSATLVAEARRDFAAKEYDKAEAKYLQILQTDRNNVYTLANLATIQLELGHLEDAEKHVQQALALSPDDAYSLLVQGEIKFRRAEYDEALDSLSRAAKLDPQNAEIQNYLGLTLSQQGMRHPAENAFRKAIQLDPRYAGAHYNLAVFYITQKPPWVELARWHYRKALDAGFPRSAEVEKMLEQTGAGSAGR